ncbi:MAG TPA: hypothetical protein VMU30_04345 [Bacteroidota bacterium]|nr:hypothetical protein [Bacteroidota bacterium]
MIQRNVVQQSAWFEHRTGTVRPFSNNKFIFKTFSTNYFDSISGITNSGADCCTSAALTDVNVETNDAAARIAPALPPTTRTLLRKLRDTALPDKAEEIAKLADANMPALAAANITADTITALRAKAAAYLDAIGARESSMGKRKGARTSMEEDFDEMDEILDEELDPAMELVRTSNPEFYNAYYALRPVKNTGVRHEKKDDSVDKKDAANKNTETAKK